MRLDDDTVRNLLMLVLGPKHVVFSEHRFRHKETGETRGSLDLRVHKLEDWLSEGRTIVKSEWKVRE